MNRREALIKGISNGESSEGLSFHIWCDLSSYQWGKGITGIGNVKEGDHKTSHWLVVLM